MESIKTIINKLIESIQKILKYQLSSTNVMELNFMAEEGFPPVSIPVHSNQDLKNGQIRSY